MRTIYKPAIIEAAGGSGVNLRTREVKLDDWWTIIDIPFDISDEEAKSTVKRFLSTIAAVEVPSSLECNLDCKYCYIRDQQLKDKPVSVKFVEKAIDLYMKYIYERYSKRKVKKFIVSPWGAEPFMNLNTLEFIVDYAAERDFSVHLSTNGTILSDRAIRVLKKLIKVSNGELIQVSLDGPPEIQNQTRPYKNSDKQTYDAVIKFIKIGRKIAEELGIKKRVIGFSSTIYMLDYNVDRYVKAIEFFANPKTEDGLLFTGFTPVRIEHHLVYTRRFRDAVIEALSRGERVIRKLMQQYNTPIMSWYTSQIFHKACMINGRCHCSALYSQLGIDLDGSLYPCHGPVTQPQSKPYFQIGNLFEGWISFTGYMAAYDRFFSQSVFSAICKDCPLLKHRRQVGRLCFICPMVFDTVDALPSSIDPIKCEAYQTIFPEWIKSYEMYLNYGGRDWRARK